MVDFDVSSKLEVSRLEVSRLESIDADTQDRIVYWFKNCSNGWCRSRLRGWLNGWLNHLLNGLLNDGLRGRLNQKRCSRARNLICYFNTQQISIARATLQNHNSRHGNLICCVNRQTDPACLHHRFPILTLPICCGHQSQSQKFNLKKRVAAVPREASSIVVVRRHPCFSKVCPALGF